MGDELLAAFAFEKLEEGEEELNLGKKNLGSNSFIVPTERVIIVICS